MVILTWNDEYRVGIDEVDHQHQGLVDMINILDSAVSEGVPTAAVAKLLGDLKAYTQYHFSTEENIMREGGCDASHMRLHLRQHRDFVRSLEQISSAYDVSGPAVAGSLLEFLLQWLMSHIMGSDKEMGRLLSSEGMPGSAEIPEPERELWLERQLDQEIAQRNMLNALRESESRFHLIADTVPVLVWMGDSGGGRSFFNRTWLDFTGRDADAEAGWGWLDDVHPEDRAAFLEQFRQSLREQTEYAAEFRLCRADGTYRWMVEHGVPRKGRSGSFAGFIGSTTDITQRKEAELAAEHACVRLAEEAALRMAKVREIEDRLKVLRGVLADGTAASAEQLEELMRHVDEALETVASCLPEHAARD